MEALEAQKLFDEGSKLLSERKFSEAKEKFLTVTKAGLSSPDLEANLGRSLVENGDLGQGIHHLELAVVGERFDSQNRQDLNFAQQKVDAGLGLPMKHPAEWGAQWASYFRPSENMALGTFLVLLVIALQLGAELKKKFKILLLFAAFLFFAFGSLGFYSRSLAVLAADSDLKSAPLESAEVSQGLKAGVRLRVVRQSGDFSEVERTGSFRGWVKSADIKRSPF